MLPFSSKLAKIKKYDFFSPIQCVDSLNLFHGILSGGPTFMEPKLRASSVEKGDSILHQGKSFLVQR